jgi:hypothetical protein
MGHCSILTENITRVFIRRESNRLECRYFSYIRPGAKTCVVCAKRFASVMPCRFRNEYKHSGMLK